ncbi:CLUMA_CG017926, isoform A [Clunio marinus]|uniref:CLUMA_CG017926, isoform A n=1 Tax=Clunio marinus TaxID=568069 RepID=A0A1J1IYV7_9DIPT|nr:CLUMA_CG017926, isoform A [Clunio marinus]
MKLSILLLLVAIIGFAASTNSTWGEIGPRDIVIHHSIIRRKSSSFMRIVTEDVRFPLPDETNNRTISAILVIDQLPKSKAYAQIFEGGVNFNHTLIHFKSERGKSFNFVLEIYGRP